MPLHLRATIEQTKKIEKQIDRDISILKDRKRERERGKERDRGERERREERGRGPNKDNYYIQA